MKIFSIFVISFFLNLIWENLHSLLYVGYKGGAITEFILIRAALGDAVIITLLALLFIWKLRTPQESWLMVIAGVFVSIAIEWYALHTGRWAYNQYMPIIPLLDVGLTPTVQLGFLGYVSYWLIMPSSKRKTRQSRSDDL